MQRSEENLNWKWPNSPAKIALALLIAIPIVFAQAPQPDGAGLEPGTIPDRWITGGPECNAASPKWQVHPYNSDLYIIRESGCTNYEKPFLYLFFGKEKAMLQDTGAGETDVYNIVTKTIAEWCKRNGRESIPLIVTHSHAHGDHVSGDKQFQNKPNITFIPLKQDEIAKAFNIAKWPEAKGSIDLGDRVLDVLAIPGHQPLSLAFYDRKTGILLTGDTVYPGRLYVTDFPAFIHSIQRLVDFTKDKPVAHVLGCHIEEAAQPFLDYPVGTKYQPEEHALALTHAHLLEINEVLKAMGPNLKRYAARDWTLWPREPRPPAAAPK